MAQFELPIYGEDNEVVKTYESNVAKFQLLVEAHQKNEEMQNSSTTEQLEIIYDMLMKIFPGLTKEELGNADIGDVFNTFAQFTRKAESIFGDMPTENSKN